MDTEISESPANMIPCKKTGELHACKVETQIYGNLKYFIVYRNVTQANKTWLKEIKQFLKFQKS